jgi:PAS domain S-box-containing protein
MNTDLDYYYNIFFLKSPCPMWVLDPQTTNFLDVNEAAIEQYGYSRDEFLTMRLPDVRANGELHLGVKLGTVVQSQRPGILYDLGNSCHKRKSGETFYVHVYSQHFLFKGNDAVLACLWDDDERVQAVTRAGDLLERTSHQSEQLQEIAWIQSHKVRRPVATILGLAQLFDTDDLDGTSNREILNGIIESASELDNVIEQIVKNTSGRSE